jgi:predicted alpha/beta-fold hydrolase
MVTGDYQRPRWLWNRHIETIFPAKFRHAPPVRYERERITTADDDFLDLDWIRQSPENLLIISHGLEGNSQRPYVRGLASAFAAHGWSVLAWNYRGCSGEMNRRLRFYHSGATDDLATVVDHAVQRGYTRINLVGFSLGGNLTLKYLGEQRVRPRILQRAVAFSVPLHLHSSCLEIIQPHNWLYNLNFLISLRRKLRLKARQFPEIDLRPLKSISNLLQFDDVYTGPLHGFAGAVDYYERSSALPFLKQIEIPTKIINAQNDPFLSRACFPTAQQIGNSRVLLEFPHRGGHVGFAQFGTKGLYWSELKALAFLVHDRSI